MNNEEVSERLIALEMRIKHFEDTCSACRRSEFGQFGDLRESMRRLDERLRAVETRVAFYAGGAALLGTIGGTLLSLIIK